VIESVALALCKDCNGALDLEQLVSSSAVVEMAARDPGGWCHLLSLSLTVISGDPSRMDWL